MLVCLNPVQRVDQFASVCDILLEGARLVLQGPVLPALGEGFSLADERGCLDQKICQLLDVDRCGFQRDSSGAGCNELLLGQVMDVSQLIDEGFVDGASFQRRWWLTAKYPCEKLTHN
ncbi:hypothetical protein D3C73_1409110 [compost metagenome]